MDAAAVAALYQPKAQDHSMFGSQWEQSDGALKQADKQLARINRTQLKIQLFANLTNK